MNELSVDDIGITEIWHGQIALLNKDKMANLLYTPKEADAVIKYLSSYGDKIGAYEKALLRSLEKGVEMLKNCSQVKAETND